jgi:hypothetical protein
VQDEINTATHDSSLFFVALIALNRSKQKLTLAGLEVERSAVKRAMNVVAQRPDHLGDAIHT